MKSNYKYDLKESAEICRKERGDIQRAIEIHAHYLAKVYGRDENKVYEKLKGMVVACTF